MQTSKEQLLRQQLIMKHLGFYKGKLDGVWSRTSIKAKCEWEFSQLFKPAYPNRGLPLNPLQKMPRGVIIDPKNRNLLTHIDLTDERIAELMGEKVVPVENLSVEREPDSVEAKRERLSENVSDQALAKRVPDQHAQHKKKKHRPHHN